MIHLYELRLKKLKEEYEKVALRAFKYAKCSDRHMYYTLQLTEISGMIEHYKMMIKTA